MIQPKPTTPMPRRTTSGTRPVVLPDDDPRLAPLRRWYRIAARYAAVHVAHGDEIAAQAGEAFAREEYELAWDLLTAARRWWEVAGHAYRGAMLTYDRVEETRRGGGA